MSTIVVWIPAIARVGITGIVSAAPIAVTVGRSAVGVAVRIIIICAVGVIRIVGTRVISVVPSRIERETKASEKDKVVVVVVMTMVMPPIAIAIPSFATKSIPIASAINSGGSESIRSGLIGDGSVEAT